MVPDATTVDAARHLECCDVCGIPLDSQPFDASGFVEGDGLPRRGETVVLARFVIHPQYCGVLQCFAQYTDLFFRYNSEVETPGLEWRLLRNGRPLFPYQQIESIINPWGYGNYSFDIRLEENSTVEFVVHNRDCELDGASSLLRLPGSTNDGIRKIGGRIMGRFWYNEIYGTRR